MSNLNDLRKSAKDMSDEQLRNEILQIRANRRNFNRGTKKKVQQAKKEDNWDLTEIEGLLADLEEE